MSDAFRRRMVEVADELEAQGVPRSTAAPPLFRLAWRMGWTVRPPLYQSFAVLATAAGVWFAAAWGLLMWLFVWEEGARSLASAVVSSLLAGALFGVAMGASYRRRARTLRLPPLC